VSRGRVCPVSWSQDAVRPILERWRMLWMLEVISGAFDGRDNTAVTLTNTRVDGRWPGFIRDRDRSGRQRSKG
jgi:hypothetical protein